MLDFRQTKQLSIKGALLPPLYLSCIRVTLAWMHPTHVTSQGLTSHEILIASITVELDLLHRGVVNPRLLGTLRLSDHLTSFENSHLFIVVLTIHISQALEYLVLFRHALTGRLERCRPLRCSQGTG